MGIPSFFRWLQIKYPLTVKSWRDVNCDNFYLDLNSIIHPCSHPEGQPQPENEEDIFKAICKAIDYLIMIVHPRRLIYLAIDGVAPKAKMNQQRARRFRSSKLAKEKLDRISHVISTMKGKKIDINAKTYHFDSNSITPGTLFMYNLSKCLEMYIKSRKRNHYLWQDLTVILSNSNVPGEGEHKIMQFIRNQQTKPNYNPNIRHVMYGADADLIMLGLSTHEKFFTIIREEFSLKKCIFCDICNQSGHTLENCKGKKTNIKPKETRLKYLSVDLDQLRKYLEKDLAPGDFKRRINDWIFLCFFVGNDFLPSIQELSIQKGAIDDLVLIYNNSGTYLIHNNKIDIKQIKKLMLNISRFNNYHTKSRDRGDYYTKKFGNKSKPFKTDVINQYIKGLCWVLKYYFVGCPSWDWYFPYLYAPFASDFKYATRERCIFNKNTSPPTPFEQLMSTLPSSSAYLLPKDIGNLMETRLAYFYPKEFEIDLNGKKYEWQGVALLPFIDSKRLKHALKGKYKLLTSIEQERNSENTPMLF